MAKKKSAANLHTYTARSKDLKILGHVEAAEEKEALKKARKLYDAASVELRPKEAAEGKGLPEEEISTPPSRLPAEATEPPASGTLAGADGPAKPGQPGKKTRGKKTTAPAEEFPPRAGGQKSRNPKSQALADNQSTTKKLSALDAAAKVLVEAGQPLNCQGMITAMAEKNYWQSPGGKTPSATLCSAILREIAHKGAGSRFQKTERGKFARTPAP